MALLLEAGVEAARAAAAVVLAEAAGTEVLAGAAGAVILADAVAAGGAPRLLARVGAGFFAASTSGTRESARLTQCVGNTPDPSARLCPTREVPQRNERGGVATDRAVPEPWARPWARPGAASVTPSVNCHGAHLA